MSSLALERSYLPIPLTSHIRLGPVTLGVAGYTPSISRRHYRELPQVLADFAALAALVSTVAGTGVDPGRLLPSFDGALLALERPLEFPDVVPEIDEVRVEHRNAPGEPRDLCGVSPRPQNPLQGRGVPEERLDPEAIPVRLGVYRSELLPNLFELRSEVRDRSLVHSVDHGWP